MPESAEFLLLTQLAETMRTRFFGKYRGLVTDISDPEGLARIRARVPAVFGDQLDSGWAMPALPFAGPQHGLALLPEVGDGVWIEFEAGDTSSPIWTGCWWARDQRPSPTGEKQRLLSTSAGHQILLDEDADEIHLTHPGGAEIVLGSSEISLKLGLCELKISTSEINLNNGMVKVTAAGASLVNDALKIGV
jgi:Type VI secretion system/phage-baseplate injector OB domain